MLPRFIAYRRVLFFRRNRMNLRAARVPIVCLLVVCSIVALGEGVLVAPSYAQINVQSKTHAHTNGPPSQTGSTTSTDSASSTGLGNGRHGGVPPGLLNAWAHSNMSVVARAVTHAIFLNGTHGVELAKIVIAASSNGQLIRNVGFNESVVEVNFDHDGALELDVNSSAKPAAVFADGNELAEVPWNVGLSPNSNAWVYDQNTHSLNIYADPSSVTIFYGSTPTPVPEFPTAILGMLFIVGLLGTVLAVRKRPRRKSVR